MFQFFSTSSRNEGAIVAEPATTTTRSFVEKFQCQKFTHRFHFNYKAFQLTEMNLALQLVNTLNDIKMKAKSKQIRVTPEARAEKNAQLRKQLVEANERKSQEIKHQE